MREELWYARSRKSWEVVRMAEQSYELMHKDDVVASLQLDDLSGAILKVTPSASPELLPLGGSQGADSLRKWWLRRAVPISQGNIAALLQQEGIPSTQSLLVRNLGLSLSDHYWIKPNGSELTWKDVSLFSNSFRDPLESMQIQHPHGAASTSTQTPAYSPSASLQGDLIKKWLIVDDTRCLLKGNRGANSQQSLNEVLASMLHEKQGFSNHVRYRPVKFTGSASEQYGCICEDFASETLEFIPAIDVVDSEKKDNAVSTYEHFIHVCTAHGLSELEVRSFLDENYNRTIKEQENSPYNIIANCDAQIDSIITRTGVGNVKKGDKVKKGDLLISGQSADSLPYRNIRMLRDRAHGDRRTRSVSSGGTCGPRPRNTLRATAGPSPKH